jgi:hypothetical protein
MMKNILLLFIVLFIQRLGFCQTFDKRCINFLSGRFWDANKGYSMYLGKSKNRKKRVAYEYVNTSNKKEKPNYVDLLVYDLRWDVVDSFINIYTGNTLYSKRKIIKGSLNEFVVVGYLPVFGDTITWKPAKYQHW